MGVLQTETLCDLRWRVHALGGEALGLIEGVIAEEVPPGDGLLDGKAEVPGDPVVALSWEGTSLVERTPSKVRKVCARFFRELWDLTGHNGLEYRLWD